MKLCIIFLFCLVLSNAKVIQKQKITGISRHFGLNEYLRRNQASLNYQGNKPSENRNIYGGNPANHQPINLTVSNQRYQAMRPKHYGNPLARPSPVAQNNQQVKTP
ncbi:hypothetical protein ACKWTF_013982 [Chironomus riparius]